ncbi:larval cuticle protein 65Ag1-like [Drosophila sulfurigaster albostrigata]|uniref:larval cuticle protein 65Ag1-like n=1 Tax=Drosophila sulfurigaster albostrigata TaxID=89887 RepID=UPI002D21873D|nr:larval cuticle protein 65Ag1-like [Drosophila sulfurigaster albostrigata]
MKFLIVFVALFAVALAAPTGQEAQIVRSESEVGPESFKYASETSDGTDIQSQGELKQIEQELALVIKGSYKWVDTDGQTHLINYIADENGYQPQGADIPVAPVV